MVSYNHMKMFIDFLSKTDNYFYDKTIGSWYNKKTLLKPINLKSAR